MKINVFFLVHNLVDDFDGIVGRGDFFKPGFVAETANHQVPAFGSELSSSSRL